MAEPLSAGPLVPAPKEVQLGRQWTVLRPPELIEEPGHRPEGYRLEVTQDSVRIAASDPAGLAHGQSTLRQLTDNGRVPEAVIRDWPDIGVRGLMLDISRDKVPTLDTLYELVDLMAALKLNHLQLYTEHTFAYRDHQAVWERSSPLHPDDIAALQQHCQHRHVELAANQNCLGHMERWLCLEPYRRLAITPDPYQDEYGRTRYPSTLDPSRPDSAVFVRGLLEELLVNFSSPRVNVGLDEPWELPDERASDYGRYISTLRSAPELDGREMLIWGDIVARHPDLVSSIPEGVTTLEWGYEADHPFAANSATLARSGRPFWVCPGTSSWNSFLGRWSNARDNCLGAAQAATGYGASGYLITDWGDHGHLQPLPVSLPGLVVGAAAAWNGAEAGHVDYAQAVSRLELDGTPIGSERARALLELGDAHRSVRPQTPNMSAVLLHLLYPRLRVGRRSTEGLDEPQLDHFDAVLDRGAQMVGSADDLFGQEMTWAVDLARLGSLDARLRLRGDGSLASVPAGDRQGLAERAADLYSRHEAVWLGRNRPGGSTDSAARLAHLAHCYEHGRATEFVPAWFRRPD